MQSQLIVLSILGFLISLYTIKVERKIRANKKYKPLCDINDKISCTRALTSPYRKTLKIKNSTAGLIFYSIIIFLAITNQFQIILYLSLIAVIGSIHLAYISYVKLKTLCIVCNTIYLINILLLIFSII